jgi:glycerol-3-phosphate O-acyltransferase
MAKLSKKRNTEDYSSRIRHDYSAKVYGSVVNLAERAHLLNLFFNNVNVEGIENVQNVGDKQLFFVSNHLSLADFLIQGKVLWQSGVPVPRYIAGENLDKFPFGKLWRKCGAYYFDRDAKRDNGYMAAYDEEIKAGLRNGENLLVYAEGGRNRGDGISRIQSGTIGQVLDVVDEGNEIWTVPCFIDYDKTIESGVFEKVDTYKTELRQLRTNLRDLKRQGKSVRVFIENLKYQRKNKLHFSWDFYAFLKRIFESDKGEAHLRFGEAFPIGEFLTSVGNEDRRRKRILTEKVEHELISLSRPHGKL